MTASKESKAGPKGTSPEALAKFASAARVKDGEVNRTGVKATTDTKAIPADPVLQHEAATAVLKEGATGADENSQSLIHELPDRILDHHK